MRGQQHSTRIDISAPEYAQMAYATFPEAPVEARAMMERTMLEHHLLRLGINKTAEEISKFAWTLQVQMSNARYELEVLQGTKQRIGS